MGTIQNLWESNLEYDNLDLLVQTINSQKAYDIATSAANNKKNTTTVVPVPSIIKNEFDEKRKEVEDSESDKMVSLMGRLELVAKLSRKNMVQSITALSSWAKSPVSTFDQFQKLEIFFTSRILEIILTTILADKTKAIKRSSATREVFIEFLTSIFDLCNLGLSDAASCSSIANNIMVNLDKLVDTSVSSPETTAAEVASVVKEYFLQQQEHINKKLKEESSAQPPKNGLMSTIKMIDDQLTETGVELASLRKNDSAANSNSVVNNTVIEKLFNCRDLQFERLQLLMQVSVTESYINEYY